MLLMDRSGSKDLLGMLAFFPLRHLGSFFDLVSRPLANTTIRVLQESPRIFGFAAELLRSRLPTRLRPMHARGEVLEDLVVVIFAKNHVKHFRNNGMTLVIQVGTRKCRAMARAASTPCFPDPGEDGLSRDASHEVAQDTDLKPPALCRVEQGLAEALHHGIGILE